MLRRLTYHMLMIPTITTTMIVLGLCIMGTVAMRGKGRHRCTVDIEESGKQRLLQQRMSSDELTHTNCHSGCHPLSEMSLKATSDHRKFLDLQAMLFATGIEHQPGPINGSMETHLRGKCLRVGPSRPRSKLANHPLVDST